MIETVKDEIDNVGSRLLAVRAHLKMTQVSFGEATGIPKSTLQKYEGSHRDPGCEALAAIARLGVNVNWLLTGAGEMLATAQHKQATINYDALIAAIVGMMQAAPKGEEPLQTAKKAVQFYQYLLQQELITPTGIGKGKFSTAA
jgi:transcriptional regulator with XRE-family HTH domain